MASDPLEGFWDSPEPTSQPTDTILKNLAPASQPDAGPYSPAFDSGQDPLDSFWSNPTPQTSSTDSTQEPATAPTSSIWQTAVDIAANLNPYIGLPKLASHLAEMIPSSDSSGEPTYTGEIRRGAAGILTGANMLALRGLSHAHEMMPPFSEKQYQNVQTSLIKNMNHYREEAAKIPTDKVIKKYQDADGMGAYFALLVNDPIGSINAANHYLAGTIPKVAAGAGAFAVGGPVAAGFTMALADVADVTGGDMLAFLAAHGVNVMNPDAVKSALNDQQLAKAMDRRGWTKGAIVAASDALFVGTGKLVMDSGLPAASKAVTDVLVGGSIGAGAAAGTQLATEGGITHPGEVWAGALGGAIIPAALHGAGKLANLGAKSEGITPEQPKSPAPEGTFLPKGPEPAKPAPRAPIDEILAQKADERGLVKVDDLPTDVAALLREERPDVIRKGGLFSGDRVSVGVVNSMLAQHAASSDVRNATSTTQQVSSPNPQSVVSDILSAKNPEELAQKVQTYANQPSEPVPAPKSLPERAPETPPPASKPTPATEVSPEVNAAQKVAQSLTETVTRNDGKPFSSSAAAKIYADAQGIKDYTFEPRDDGVVLKVAPPKKPDITQQEGQAQLTKDVAELTAHPAQKSAPEKLPEIVPLTHWGNTAGLSELDPSAYGTATAGAEKTRQGPGFLPRTYYGMPGYKVESVVDARAKARYFTSIPKKDLYDLKADPLGLRVKAENAAKQREEDYFKRKGYRVVEPATTTDVENEVAKAGYKGYFVDDVAAVFDKLPVEEVTHVPMEVHGVAGYNQRGARNQPLVPAKPRLKKPAAVAEPTPKTVEPPAAQKQVIPAVQKQVESTAPMLKPEPVEPATKSQSETVAQKAPAAVAKQATKPEAPQTTSKPPAPVVPEATSNQATPEAPETPRLSVSRAIADEQAQLAQRSPDEVARIARKVENVKAWFKDDPHVDTVGTVSNLPFVVRPGTRAAAWRGRVYLVADEITNRTDARNLYAHELVGHLKAEQVKGYHELLGDIITESTKPGIVQTVWQGQQDRRPWASPDELAREVVAVLSERSSKHPAIRRMVNTYRSVLRKLGAINPVESKIYDTIEKAYRQRNVTYDNTAWSSVDVPGWTRQEANKFVLQYLDDTDPLKKAEAATKMHGVRNKVLLQRSYVVDEVDQALDTFVRPMEEARRRSGFTDAQVSNFLHARTALEANPSLRERNIQRMVEAGVIPKTDPSGNIYDWNAIFQNNPDNIPAAMIVNHPDYQYWHNLWKAPSGMTDKDARAIVDEFQGDPDMQIIGDHVDAIGKDRLDRMESSGFISADRRAQFENAYKHYAPLFRDIEDVNERVAIQGRSSKMARIPVRIRKGSTRQVSDVYSNLIADYQKIIIQCSQNNVFKLFYDQVESGLAGDMFKINGTSEQVALDAAGNITTKDVIDVNPNEAINGFVDGKRNYIVANKEDPLALTVVRAWNQMDHARIGAFMRNTTRLARFIARMVTSMSFDFLAGNAPRDIFTAQMNVTGKEIGGAVSGRVKMLRDWAQAFSQIYANQVFGTGGTYADVFNNMKRGGGAMSWMEMFPDEPQKNMARIQARYDKRWYHPGEGAARNAQLITTNATYKLLGFFEHLGTATENATRATVWKAVNDASLAQGRSQTDAAERANMAARDTTADFLRTGTRSKQIGAFYLFFNPTMQSNAKAISRIKENPKVRIPVLLAMIAAAAVQSMLARKFSDDDNKDGISNYDEPSIEWTKDRNLLYPIPKSLGTSSNGNQLYVTQPIPYFYNIFTTVGNILGDMASGALKPPTPNDQIKNPIGRAAFRISSAAIDSLSPFGNPAQSSWSQTLAPTLMDLVVQGGANESAFGTPLYPDKAGPWDNRLMWQRSWNNTPEIYKKIGKFIHEDIFAGDDTSEGWAAQAKIDFLSNPEVLQDIAQQFGGGLVSLLEKTRNYANKGSVNDITGLRRFIREPVPSQDLSQNWYAAKGVMDQVTAVLQGKDQQEIAAYRRDHPEMQLSMRWNSVNRQIAKQKAQLKKYPEASPQYENLQQSIEDEQLRFIRALNKLRAAE